MAQLASGVAVLLGAFDGFGRPHHQVTGAFDRLLGESEKLLALPFVQVVLKVIVSHDSILRRLMLPLKTTLAGNRGWKEGGASEGLTPWTRYLVVNWETLLMAWVPVPSPWPESTTK